MNCNSKYVVLLFLMMAFSFRAMANIELSFPAERAVFQRDNNNFGAIAVMGIAEKEATKILARLVPMVVGQGVETNWQVIDETLIAGSFSGKVQGSGGWYRLELQSYNGDQLISTQYRDRVGIGEVFVVSGQSNAQGFLRYTQKGASDDRVNGYGFYKEDFIDENIPISQLIHLDREKNIGPHGQSAWAWGEFGDRMAAKYNVPILIINTAYEGTTVENWVKSADGEPTTHTAFGFTFPHGTPYSFLRISLQNLIPLYGIRSIIWMQGESDYRTDGDLYYRQLKYLINKVGFQIGKDINWMVTKTSRSFNVPHKQIIAAQSRVIDELPNVYEGPLTDNLGLPRVDGVHFFNGGLGELAESIEKTFTSSLLNEMIPYQGQGFVPVSATCAGTNQAQVQLNEGFSEIKWNGYLQENSIQLTNGRAQALVRTAQGDYRYSEILEVGNLFPVPPKLTADNGTIVCDGNSTTISVDRSDYKVEWQDGSTNRTYSASVSQNIFASYITEEGCKSGSSEGISVQVVPNPAAPNIVSLSGSFGACEGETVVLKAETIEDRVKWSSGESSHNVIVADVGEKSYSVQAISKHGCYSPASAETQVKIFTRPSPPNITQNGPYSLGVTNAEEFETFDWKLENRLLDDQHDSQILAENGGYYSIVGYERHQMPFDALCRSNDSGYLHFEKVEANKDLLVYPNPVVVGGLVFLASDRPIENVVISISDVNGKLILSPTSIQNVYLPKEIKLPSNVNGDMVIMTVSYEGMEKKFKLFFK